MAEPLAKLKPMQAVIKFGFPSGPTNSSRPHTNNNGSITQHVISIKRIRGEPEDVRGLPMGSLDSQKGGD